MTLTNTWMLNFLWALPLFIFLFIVQYRRRRQALERFAEKHLLNRLTLEHHKTRRIIKAFLLLTALGVLIVALAGPRWGNRYQEVSRKGVDIMVLVDVSHSMLVADVEPNRLERATREIIDFIRVIEGDRIGLTIFSGTAFIQCPLTFDYAAMEMFLDVLQPGIIPVPGTDLGAAIDTALTAFDPKAETDKVMLLITDGEDNEKLGLKAAQNAADQGVKIFVFGIGDPSGGPIPEVNDQGGFKKDRSGNLVLSKLDEKTLQEIAVATGGGYVRSASGDLDLDIIYFDGIKQKTEALTLKSGKVKVYEERFNVFILAAIILLIFEEMLDDKRRPATKKRYIFFSILISFGFIYLWASPLALAAESPDTLYRQGKYEAAAKAYAQKDMDHPRDARFRYNRGCAAFQNGQYDEAAAAFSSVFKRSQDDKDVRFKAAYNLGNTAFKQGDFSGAIQYYKNALIEQPDNQDARYNFEMALRALEREEEQQRQEHTQTPDSQPPGMNQQPEDQAENQNSKDQAANEGDQPRDDEKDKIQKSEKDPKQNKTSSDHDESNQATKNADQDRIPSKPPQSKDETDLSGDLKARQDLSKPEEKDAMPQVDVGNLDKKKAEALLDNIQENPSQILRFMISDQDRQAHFSGKDW